MILFFFGIVAHVFVFKTNDFYAAFSCVVLIFSIQITKMEFNFSVINFVQGWKNANAKNDSRKKKNKKSGQGKLCIRFVLQPLPFSSREQAGKCPVSCGKLCEIRWRLFPFYWSVCSSIRLYVAFCVSLTKIAHANSIKNFNDSCWK